MGPRFRGDDYGELNANLSNHPFAISHNAATVFQFRVVAPSDNAFSIAVFDSLVSP